MVQAHIAFLTLLFQTVFFLQTFIGTKTATGILLGPAFIVDSVPRHLVANLNTAEIRHQPLLLGV